MLQRRKRRKCEDVYHTTDILCDHVHLHLLKTSRFPLKVRTKQSTINVYVQLFSFMLLLLLLLMMMMMSKTNSIGADPRVFRFLSFFFFFFF